VTESAPDTPVEEMSFEAAMQALEQVVDRLEGGDVPLEESIALYERGAALRRRCEAKLQEAELRVRRIVEDETGAAAGARPVDPEDPTRPLAS
jgi:exodeoxyribonuclease VII small subunit